MILLITVMQDFFFLNKLKWKQTYPAFVKIFFTTKSCILGLLEVY